MNHYFEAINIMDNALNLFSILKFTIYLGKKLGEKLQSPHNKTHEHY